MAKESKDGYGYDWLKKTNVAASAPVVSYEDAREYKIENLILPSTGVPLDVKVLTWKAASFL